MHGNKKVRQGIAPSEYVKVQHGDALSLFLMIVSACLRRLQILGLTVLAKTCWHGAHAVAHERLRTQEEAVVKTRTFAYKNSSSC
mgnify:CR=1 FL=1